MLYIFGEMSALSRLDIDDMRKRFADDKFATCATGAVIDNVEPDCAQVSLEISDKHCNASGGVMGGAIFTLADFAFAVASNQEDMLTVSVSSTIQFIGKAQGRRLIASAKPDKIGRSMCFYTIKVVDELDTLVAIVSITGKRTNVVLTN